MVNKISTLLLSIVVAFIIGEIFILIIGYRVFRPTPVFLQYQPARLGIPDSLLGYTSTIGLQTTNKNNQLFSSATHWTDHSRATRPQEAITSEQTPPRVHLYGCSLTYGQHLEDSMTMGWKLQSKLPGWDVRNYGFVGYGINQSYLQFKAHLLQQHKPQWVIVNYASFHDERNVLTRNRRKQLVPYIRQKELLDSLRWPKVTSPDGRNLEIIYEKITYQEWPGMRYSALIHFLEHAYNQIIRDKEQEQLISFLILQKMHQLATQQNIRFLVTGIFSDDKTKQVLERCRMAGIQVLDISVDLEDEQFNLMPYDGHPNARAHSVYAERIFRWIMNRE